ncbi:hypothetical protein BGZ98_002446 [Dissophora globulifera]|nr:hypothetical protein BGZ98_002446 [Dissophora globulifera]
MSSTAATGSGSSLPGVDSNRSNTSGTIRSSPSDGKRKKWRPPMPNTGPAISSSLGPPDDDDWGLDTIGAQEFHEAFGDIEDGLMDTAESTRPVSVSSRSTTTSTPILTTTSTGAVSTTSTTSKTSTQAPKRRKVGLSRVSGVPANAVGHSSLISPHRPPSTQLEFPNAARCTNFSGKNSSQHLRRSLTLGYRFMSTSQYKDGMAFLIYEHLQIMVIEIAITMWSIKANPNTREGDSMDALYRSRGIHMHSGSSLRRRGDSYVGFPIYSERSMVGSGDSLGGVNAVIQPSSQQAASLSISNKEHHSKYSKDDLWVISTTPKFDAASTFFARSVFYGPSGGDIELLCLSSKDSSKARDIFTNNTGSVCAIRLFNAMSEFMMLDNLENLTQTPLLPVLLNYVPPELVKASKTAVFKVPSRVPEKTGCIVLTEEDGIDVELEIQDTVDFYHLNLEQAQVLRSFAQTVIRAPGWMQKSAETPPILLVHGKSFLIAVLIVFIDNILNKARPLPREERSCRFLVASMTNVAVDRILTALLDLNYTKFVRVGSLKKVARRVLPYTAQSTSNRTGEEIKELQSILDDDSVSTKERQYVRDAMKRFQKLENRGIVEGANVVGKYRCYCTCITALMFSPLTSDSFFPVTGVTCIASTFEVLDNVSFPIVILDEASQLLEAMSLIPICRAAAEKVIMVGDPLQLSPPINTNGDTSGTGKGLSRTLFDRSSEMGLKPVMLQTQYRCHRRIAEISNTLFYSNALQTGASDDERAPLIEGLPTLTFIDNVGQEIQNPRTKSFTNPAEIRVIVGVVQRLLSLNIPEASIDKSQADGIQAELSEQLKNSGMKGTVQISTVDAFQGSEKDVIIVSTVRTDTIGFIDNHQRVNVALTRSKRHLFIVGKSQLLSSNSVWGPVIKDHCSGSSDGFMRGDQFVQRLRALTPLAKQAEVEQEVNLSESEDEVDKQDDDGRHGRDHNGNADDDDNDSLSDEDDGDDVYATGNLRSGHAAPPRMYALYQADEDESENSQDERELQHPQALPTALHTSGSTTTPSYIQAKINTSVSMDYHTRSQDEEHDIEERQEHDIKERQQHDLYTPSLEGVSQLEGAFELDIPLSFTEATERKSIKSERALAQEEPELGHELKHEQEQEVLLWEDDDGEANDVAEGDSIAARPDLGERVKDNAAMRSDHVSVWKEMDEEEDDDMSCLEVGELDMI